MEMIMLFVKTHEIMWSLELLSKEGENLYWGSNFHCNQVITR